MGLVPDRAVAHVHDVDPAAEAVRDLDLENPVQEVVPSKLSIDILGK